MSFNKLLKISLQKVFNFFVNGRWCFLCVTCSTCFTMMFLCLKVDSSSNIVMKSTVLPRLGTVNNKQHTYVTTASAKKTTKSLSEMLKTIPEINQDVVFLNSVPRSGGELLILLLQWLQEINGFKHVRLPSPKRFRLSRYEQDDVVQIVMNEVRNGALPFTFDREVHFINFTSFGQQSPTYLSLVRDPIDRAIARFQYNQVTPTAPFYHSSTLGTSRKKAKLNHLVVKEFEKCIIDNEARCTYKGKELNYDLTIPYFCGYSDQCMIHNDKWALERAKENIERYYPVVGLLEDMNTTLTVLQTQLPYFFKNVVDFYNTQLSKKHKFAELQRPKRILSSEIKKILEKQLATEYEFYHYVKKRLYKQHAII